MADTVKPRRAGRPPSERTQQAILEATRELLAEGGVQGLTVEGVAGRAGVAKTTIYRRYRSKDELALAVLIDMVEHVASVPDLGDTRAELVAFVDRAVKILGSTLMGRVMQGLVSDLATDRELARAFRERVVALRVAELQRLIERGIARGDLRPDADYELANELLFGPVYYRLLLSGEPLDDDLAERVVEAVLPAFTARSPRRRRETATSRAGSRSRL
jgi:AcrR family transcriptional regulator